MKKRLKKKTSMIELKLTKEKISKILLREKTSIVLGYKLKDLLLSLIDDKEYCTVKLNEPYLMTLEQINNQFKKHLLTKEEVENFGKKKLYLYQILKVKLLKLRRKKNEKSQKMRQIKQKIEEHKTTKKTESNSTVKELHMKKPILRVKRRVEKGVYMDIMKPYPNETSVRIKNPEDFKKGSFRSHQLKKGLRRIAGRLKSNNKWQTQSYRFHVDYYTLAQVKEWLKKHKIKYLLIEPATNVRKG